jgi:hypothetical protein
LLSSFHSSNSSNSISSGIKIYYVGSVAVHSKWRGEIGFHSIIVLIISIDPTLSGLLSENYITCIVLLGHLAGVKATCSALIGQSAETQPLVLL